MSLPLTVSRGAETVGAISLLPIDIIHPNPYQPRTHFEQDALDELCASIQRYGILQPITVRRLGSTYELVAGERRLRAAKAVGMQTVPAVIVQIGEKDMAVLALIENLQRCDLSYMEEAEGYEKLLRLHGLTQQQIAESVGKTQSAIANKLRLLKLPSVIKKGLQAHHLTERHARALLRLGEDCKLQMQALESIVSRELNVSQTEALIERLLTEKGQKPKRSAQIKTRSFKLAANTLKQAVNLIQKSGIAAVLKESKSDAYVEYIITLPL